MRNAVRYFIAPLLLFALVVYVVSFTPSAMKSAAESDFHNIVGIDIDINTKLFDGPFKVRYDVYRWIYAFPAGDTAFVDVHVPANPFTFNKIVYRFSAKNRSIDDLPGRERYKDLLERTALKNQL